MIRRNNAGFTLIELMIVVAIIAIIASIAIPKLMSARLSANEAAAISTLRSISSAQAQIQSSAAIDCDADGAGEYGYFAELAGAQPMRVSNAGVPAAGTAGTDELNPSVLASAFGAMTVGVVTRSGYCFQMWLPDAANAGVPETATGLPAAPFPDPNNNEILWCCYAWPMDVEGTGNRAFFINQEGDLLQCQNRLATGFSAAVAVAPFTTPGYGECYNTATDMSSGLLIGAATPTGNTWTAVQ